MHVFARNECRCKRMSLQTNVAANECRTPRCRIRKNIVVKLLKQKRFRPCSVISSIDILQHAACMHMQHAYIVRSSWLQKEDYKLTRTWSHVDPDANVLDVKRTRFWKTSSFVENIVLFGTLEPPGSQSHAFPNLAFHWTWAATSNHSSWTVLEHHAKTQIETCLTSPKHLHSLETTSWTLVVIWKTTVSAPLHDQERKTWWDPNYCTCHTHLRAALCHGLDCDRSSSTQPATTYPAKWAADFDCQTSQSSSVMWHPIILQNALRHSNCLNQSAHVSYAYQLQKGPTRARSARQLRRPIMHRLVIITQHHLRLARSGMIITKANLFCLNLCHVWLASTKQHTTQTTQPQARVFQLNKNGTRFLGGLCWFCRG